MQWVITAFIYLCWGDAEDKNALRPTDPPAPSPNLSGNEKS